MQSLLAVAFAASGVVKTTKFREQLRSQLPWVSDVPAAVVRLIGLAEFTAGDQRRLSGG
ncbi:DoxX family protein [Streptomyces mirabilis]|uniref:DoxX family protein n=1 Tax=Streptomyces mirabilis TaxID=68239 RepID=UPI00343420DD